MSKDKSAKKPVYKRAWFWIALIILVVIVANAGGNKQETKNTGGAGTSTSETKPAEWNADVAYEQIQNGQSKAEVDKINAGKKPSCYESTTEGVGVTNICTYGNLFTDKKAITVTYINDAVFSKSRQTN